ncbi:hypothetical protein EG68_03328 [Paragonimus skrjabini miyazakii]|uniref:Protein ABHD18 n=1 Tax=Paragonimus skrjabini miyazakii TaxID=59628 RepID=A0A8S9Z2P3_9TREM|nr:hypothetical protein EG68_03328 [Paragonimus skrjabini miyazakii]
MFRRLIENFNSVSKLKKFEQFASGDFPIVVDTRTEHKNTVLVEGSFVSPFEKTLPNVMDAENCIARFQLVLPKEWTTKYKPICIHLAGTGDHTYSRRRFFLANRLLSDGIGSLIVMNPFYWKRKPKDQRGSSLNYVSDLFVMGGALITECYTLLKWCEMNGYGPLALHGISMGGYMASLCATVWPKPISLIPCLSWTTASVVFVEGILANAVDWSTLTKQYFSDSVYCDQIRPLIQPSVPDRYKCTSTEASAPSVASSTNSRSPVPPSITEGRIRVPDRSTHDVHVPASDVGSSPSSDVSTTPSPTDGDRSCQLPTSSSPMLEAPSASQPPSTQSDLSKTLFFLSLTPLKQFQLSDAWSSWNLPDTLRRPFDASLWHTGVSMLRSWPDNLGIVSSPPDPEVSQFMRELLDYFTHLGNFSPLVEPRLVLAVAAEHDAYIPRHGVIPLNELYPGAEIRLLPQSGHVGAYLRNAIWTRDFRQAITDCLNRQVELCHNEPGPFGITQTKPTTARLLPTKRKH